MCINDLFSLKGKYIIVTGGTRGIGRAISIQLASAGASVVSNYIRDIKSAEELKHICEENGYPIELCRADLTSDKGLGKIADIVDKSQKKLAGLIHCAATGVHRLINELDSRHFDWTFSLNVRAYFNLVKLLLPKFAEGASIVALSSAGAKRAAFSYSLVGASKGALESLSRHFALELASKKIRVNILSPGAVLTDSWNVLPNREERLKERIKRSPYNRLITLDEVSWAAHFLCSNASSGINGQTIIVDGGECIVE